MPQKKGMLCCYYYYDEFSIYPLERVNATNNTREKASWMKSVELNPRTNA